MPHTHNLFPWLLVHLKSHRPSQIDKVTIVLCHKLLWSPLSLLYYKALLFMDLYFHMYTTCIIYKQVEEMAYLHSFRVETYLIRSALWDVQYQLSIWASKQSVFWTDNSILFIYIHFLKHARDAHSRSHLTRIEPDFGRIQKFIGLTYCW